MKGQLVLLAIGLNFWFCFGSGVQQPSFDRYLAHHCKRNGEYFTESKNPMESLPCERDLIKRHLFQSHAARCFTSVSYKWTGLWGPSGSRVDRAQFSTWTIWTATIHKILRFGIDKMLKKYCWRPSRYDVTLGLQKKSWQSLFPINRHWKSPSPCDVVPRHLWCFCYQITQLHSPTFRHFRLSDTPALPLTTWHHFWTTSCNSQKIMSTCLFFPFSHASQLQSILPRQLIERLPGQPSGQLLQENPPPPLWQPLHLPLHQPNHLQSHLQSQHLILLHQPTKFASMKDWTQIQQ